MFEAAAVKKVMEQYFGNTENKTVLINLQRGKLELISFCEMNQINDTQCRDRFHHVPTASGICSSFNSMPMSELLKSKSFDSSNQFMESFKDYYNVNLDQQPKSISKLSPNMLILVDIHNFELQHKSKPGSFIVNIGSSLDVIDSVTKAHILQAGQRLSINVVPR